MFGRTRHAGTEICDGLDNDCDNQVDEGFNLGDVCTVGTGQCASQGVYQCGSTGAAECSAQPGTPATEVCDGVDNDCDDQVDEGFDLGLSCTAGVGQCLSRGVYICASNGESVCSAQPGTPNAEVCDGSDNDCDGETDEGFGLGNVCVVGTGQCTNTGVLICDQNGGSICSAEPGTPSTEVCDGTDNDCDTIIDEGFNLGESCTEGTGLCQSQGIYACNPDGAADCTANPGTPQVEICDGLDNDCDGQVDEGFELGSSCTVGVGQCANQGVTVCSPTGTTTCSVQPGTPGTEICDGQDNDCDNLVDEGFELGGSCVVGVGQCASQGVYQCAPNGTSECSATPGTPGTEICDGLDNDCDNQVDEGFNLGDSCSEGTGQCSNTGVYVCSANGTSECSAEPGVPVVESCDALDNDCDGEVDEGFNLGESCVEGVGQCAQQGVYICGPDGVAMCTAVPGQPANEICDGIDNDCDVAVDEDFNLGETCSVGIGECSNTGVIACGTDGGTSCSAEPNSPSAEVCDGLDNDCDENIDEDFELGSSCEVGTGACLNSGVVICGQSGEAVCNAVPHEPGIESCNGIDDDCDSEIDEGFNLGESCTAGTGACETVGELVCGPNGISICSVEGRTPTPGVEICDELDNDCDGLIDDGLIDRCGVCGGDGTSCLGCSDIDIKDKLFALDGGAGKQKEQIRLLSSILSGAGHSSKTKKVAKSTMTRAEELYRANWTLAWSIPQVITSCENTSFCVSVSHTSAVSGYVNNADELFLLTNKLIKELKKYEKNSKRVRRFQSQATRLHQVNLGLASEVPLSTSNCG